MKISLTTLPLKKLQRIADALAPFEVRLVGGVVRDLVSGVPPGDIDLCTTATPNEMITACHTAHLRYEPTGLDHGTLTLIVAGQGFETTSLRRDVTTDGRHATVAFTRNFAEDAARRDFTINALYADFTGNIDDPTGGLDDLRHGILRFVGEASARIREDHLRILRFYRFYARFGHTLPNDNTRQALQDLAPHITTLPKERIHPEVMKLLAAENPLPSLRLMVQYGSVLSLLGLGDSHLGALERHRTLCGTTSGLERLACMLWQVNMPATLQKSHLNPTRAEIKTLRALEKSKSIPFTPHNPLGWAYRVGYALAPLALRCSIAHGLVNEAIGHEILGILSHTQAPIFPVTGDDLIAAGLTPGPKLGQTLHRLENWWLDNDRPDTATCLHHLRQI